MFFFKVTKIFQKKKNSVSYSFRQSFSLYGMQLLLFENQCKCHFIFIGCHQNVKANDNICVCMCVCVSVIKVSHEP